jgi:hypothetical protein
MEILFEALCGVNSLWLLQSLYHLYGMHQSIKQQKAINLVFCFRIFLEQEIWCYLCEDFLV